MTTLKEQYEAMVARGHLVGVGRRDGEWVTVEGSYPVRERIVAACLQAGHLAAMEKAGISYFYNAGRQYPYQIKMPGTDKWKVYGSWFTAYLTAFPPSAPPDPAAELAEAADMCRDAVKMFVEAIDSNSSVDVEAALEFGRKAWHAYDARFDAAKGGEK